MIKRAIERLNGDVRVTTSTSGTVFVITLPITLAITRAVLVRAGAALYAVPLYFADRILDGGDAQFVISAGRRRLVTTDGLVGTSHLRELTADARDTAAATTGPLLVLRVGGDAIAIQVDAVVAQEEIVIKPLGPILDGHPLFAGVTLRGSGELALILDVPSLFERGRATAAPAAHRALPEALAPAVAALAPATAPARRRVLFVDDSVSVRKVAERTLTELGVDVVLAVDGADGLARLRDGGFDLVFTDLEMPRMHGYDLIRELRYVPAHKDLPVVVVSSRSGQKHQDHARALGATDYVTKPFSREVLETVLARWLGKGGRGDA